MTELPEALHQEILHLSALGDAAAEIEDYETALSLFHHAYSLLPEPRHQWEAGLWLATALADVSWLKNDYPEARNWLLAALVFPEGVENPFVQMRLGQCYFELHDESLAQEHLLRAYLLDGMHVFEDEDPKYLISIKKTIL